MRSIVSKKDDEKTRKILVSVLGIALVVIMFFSVLGYGFMGKDDENNSQKLIYNGFEFTNNGGYWVTKIGEIDFIFRNSPKETEDLNLEYSGLIFLSSYSGETLYFDSDNPAAETEIAQNLRDIATRIQYGCISEEDCEKDAPIKNCQNNTVIVIREKEFSKITQDEKCVFIEGPAQNLTKITDEFLFRITGIKK